jgi:hypothetical protein
MMMGSEIGTLLYNVKSSLFKLFKKYNFEKKNPAAVSHNL